MAIQYATGYQAAMPPKFHPTAKAVQQSKQQRIGQEPSQFATQDAMAPDLTGYDPTSQLQDELDEHTRSQRQDHASSTPHHMTNRPIAPSLKYPDRSHQHNEKQVDAFLNELETHIQTTNPGLYSRLQAQHPNRSTTSTSTSEPFQFQPPISITEWRARSNETESWSSEPRRAAAKPRASTARSARYAAVAGELGSSGGPQQTGANLVPVSGRRRGLGRDGNGGGDGRTVAGERGGTVVTRYR